jgi:hypothetical protein
VHVFEHDAVVSSVESGLEVRVHDTYVFCANFCDLHHHDDGVEGIMDAAKEAESVLLLA